MVLDKQKNKIILAAAGLLLIGAAVFGWEKFGGSQKNTIQLEKEIPGAAEGQAGKEIGTGENTGEGDKENIGTKKVEPAPSVSGTKPEPKTENSTPKKEVSPAPGIKKRLISWGFQKTDGRKIDTIIIHSSYDAIGSDPYSVSGILEEYKQYGVSAHYLMDRQGQLYQLVEDKNIAYHAGVAKLPDGRTNVNEVSIGIEMMNTKDDKFTAAQYESLNNFLDFLKGEYKIRYVLGHDQVASGRKDDPWNFDWKKIKS